jgi:hypothetical protein
MPAAAAHAFSALVQFLMLAMQDMKRYPAGKDAV